MRIVCACSAVIIFAPTFRFSLLIQWRRDGVAEEASIAALRRWEPKLHLWNNVILVSCKAHVDCIDTH